MPSPSCELRTCFVPLPGPLEPAPQEPTLAASGFCPDCNLSHSLPRTPLAEDVAALLRKSIEQSDTINLFTEAPSPPSAALSVTRLERDSGGKMFGVLLCETPEGEPGYLRAFSGQFNRIWTIPGWVPPILDLSTAAPHQARVEEQVDALTRTINQLKLQQTLQKAHLQNLSGAATAEINDRLALNATRRQERKVERENLPAPPPSEALGQLNNQSRDDKESLRRLRRKSQEAITPLTEQLSRLEEEILQLKRSRRALSSQLSLDLHDTYTLCNFNHTRRPLREAFLNPGIPTGAGDCCAPKLLHFAALHGLKPISLAEFWMGSPKREGRVHGNFYSACEEKCTPLLGFMLCGSP